MSEAPAANQAAALLRFALADGDLPPARRVYVNRNLRLEKIRFIGFDLDWTVAAYAREPLEQLIFELSLDRLVEHFGYAPAARRASYRRRFPHRGLIVDRQAGTVLKMNRHRYVGRAYLGRQELGRAERARLYRQDRLELKSDRFYWVDTLFELPEVALFSELVDLVRRGELAVDSYDRLFTDVRAAVDGTHAEGPLKSNIAADLPRYLPRDPDLPIAMERLRLGGRRLMLVTNSSWHYTEQLCSYLFDGSLPGLGSWRELFDLVVVSSRKPEFFRQASPFVELDDDGREVGRCDTPEWGRVYAGGSRFGLMDLMQAPGESVLYVGDHIYGDIVSSKMTSTWRTALVVSELEDEIENQGEEERRIERLQALKGELSALGRELDDLRDVMTLTERLGETGSPAASGAQVRARLARLESDHRTLRERARDLQETIAARHNPTWGSVFKEGGSQSLFGSQVHDFSCIYTSRVSNFAYYGTNHYFRVLQDPMAHELEP